MAFIRSFLDFLTLVLASLSTRDYMAKSKGLISGEEGGHIALSQKFEIFFQNYGATKLGNRT